MISDESNLKRKIDEADITNLTGIESATELELISYFQACCFLVSPIAFVSTPGSRNGSSELHVYRNQMRP